MDEKRKASGSKVGSTVGVTASMVGGMIDGSMVGACVAVDVDSIIGVSVFSPPHADRTKMNNNWK
jgi:hypothetical protein